MKRAFAGLITDMAKEARSHAKSGDCDDAVATVNSMERRIQAFGPKQRKSRESIVRKAKRVVGALCTHDDEGGFTARKMVKPTARKPVEVRAKDVKGDLNEDQMIKLLISLGIHPDKWLQKDADPFTRKKMMQAFEAKQADGRGKKK